MHHKILLNKPTYYSSKVRNVDFGTDVTLVEPCNLYECKIGDYTFIGPFVEIQKNVVIGAKCRIQSHSFICSKVKIGDNCFVGHGVMFTNDLFKSGKPSPRESDWLSTVIGQNVSIGSNATILPTQIVDNTVIGAGAVVTKDILVPGIYAGNPAKLIRKLN